MSEMSTDRSPEPGQYEIRLEGRLHSRWAAWFDGMSLTLESDGTTVLSGPVIDQAALHCLLQKVRDVGLPLISVAQLDRRSPTCPPSGVTDPSIHTGRST